MAGRTWLAVALACLVWFGYLKWFAPPPSAPVTTQSSTTPAASSTPTAPTGPRSPFDLKFAGSPKETLANGDMKLTFSAEGGRPVKGEIFSHRRTIKDDAPYMTPVSPETNPYAFATLFTDPALLPFSNGTYGVQVDDRTARYTRAEGGIRVEKEYHLDDKGHFFDARFRITLPEGNRNEWGHVYVPLGGANLTYDYNQPLEAWEAVAYQNGSVNRKIYDDVETTEEVVQGNTGWIAFGNRYFATAVINSSAVNPDVVFSKRGDWRGVYLRYPLVTRGDQKIIELSYRYFVGPKEVSELAQVEGMKGLVDYGFFKIFAYPLLEILRFFYRIFHNYGVAIILLTILVRLAFYPLSLKSYRSMKAMQKLQPQIQALRERYKDDMQRFNQEQIALFKTHKVNPMGGCLPMLVQLPVFFALYTVLSNSIDLFHAPFLGWIQDLSAKDPYYILPILMGVSMFVQQKMTPAAGLDPIQQKMMLAMPIVFTFIMLNLPSGLTLYIFLSTLLGILQQMVINKESNRAEGKVVAATNQGPTK